jgi:hypothetical protein
MILADAREDVAFSAAQFKLKRGHGRSPIRLQTKIQHPGSYRKNRTARPTNFPQNAHNRWLLFFVSNVTQPSVAHHQRSWRGR